MDKLFNTCRIPLSKCDALFTHPPRNSEHARKILVMIEDQMYTVEVYRSDMTPLKPAEIEVRLLEAVKDFDTRTKSGELLDPVGVLSSDDRDSWALVCHPAHITHSIVFY